MGCGMGKSEQQLKKRGKGVAFIKIILVNSQVFTDMFLLIAII